MQIEIKFYEAFSEFGFGVNCTEARDFSILLKKTYEWQMNWLQNTIEGKTINYQEGADVADYTILC